VFFARFLERGHQSTLALILSATLLLLVAAVVARMMAAAVGLVVTLQALPL
jgi:hypothetical protein